MGLRGFATTDGNRPAPCVEVTTEPRTCAEVRCNLEYMQGRVPYLRVVIHVCPHRPSGARPVASLDRDGEYPYLLFLTVDVHE